MSRLPITPAQLCLLLFGLLCLSPALGFAQEPGVEANGAEGPGAPPSEAGEAADAPGGEPPAAQPASALAPIPSGPNVSLPCAPGNLLKGRKPVRASGVGHLARLNDGVAPKEGAEWRTNLTSVMQGEGSEVVFDLGGETVVRSLMLQGDNNDTYLFSGSTDGRNFSPIWKAPFHPEPGMRTRLEQGLNVTIRFLRVSNPVGDNAFSVGEVMAFCEHPTTWPPALERKDSTFAKPVGDVRAERMAQGKTALAVLAALTFLGFFLYGRRRDPAVLLLAPVGGGAALLYAAWMTSNEAKLLDPKGLLRVWEGRALTIAALLVGGLAVAIIVRMASNKPFARIAERGALLGLVVASALSWVNFGTFHGSRVVHYWDTFHYYMGSKYFPEVGYTNLYHCSGVAELDDGLRPEFEKRQLRDLRNNQLGKALPALDDDRGCRAAFTTERWAAFRQDLRLFRSYMGSSWWAKMFKDHGYNATPVWNLVGSALTNVGWADGVPAVGRSTALTDQPSLSAAERSEIRKHFNDIERPEFEARIERLVSLDFALYAGLFLLIGWAFGLRACALAMVVWGSGYPWAYFWTGGGFGRVPWLFMAVAGLCLLRKNKTVLGGFALTWSALLRGFPAGLVVGVSLQIAWRFIATLLGRSRPAAAADGVPVTDRLVRPAALAGILGKLPISKAHWRFIAGCTLAVGILIPGSVSVAESWQAWPAFMANTAKHKDTPLTNHMGLPTLLSYKTEVLARNTKNDKLEDPFALWKVGRKETLASRKVIHYGILAVFALVLAYASRRLKDWEVTALSGLFIIGVFELTCYYYSFVVMLAPFALRRWRYVFAYLGMSVATQVIREKFGWYDEQYTWESLAVLAVYVYFLADSAWRIRKGLPDDAEAWVSAESIEAAIAAEAPPPAVSLDKPSPTA